MSLLATYKRWILLLSFVIIAVSGFYLSAPYLNLSSLHHHYLQLNQWKQQHFLLGILFICLLYITLTSLAVPGAIWLTILTGFLYGNIVGLIMVVISATTGATILYSIARWLGAAWLRKKFSNKLIKFEKGIDNNIWSYLFILRLLPVFPFTMINIAAGLLNIRMNAFVLTTLIGIMPGTFVYVSLGKGLNTIFASGQKINVNLFFQPNIIIPLVGLAILACIPILYKWLRKGKRYA